MKGWVKGMLIGAAACLGVGAAVCVGAWAMGGRFFYFHQGRGLVEMWKEDDDIWDEDPEDIAVYEGTTSVGRYGKRTDEESAEMETSERLRKEARSGGTIVRELEVEVLGGWVEIVADDSSDQIVVISNNEDYQCRQELDEDKLEIYVDLYSGLWQNLVSGRDAGELGDDDDLAARILIPEGAQFRKVELEVKGGGLYMSQVTAQKLNLDLQAGVLEVEEGSVEQLDGECKAGELIYQGQVGQKMEAECVTGNIQYQIYGNPEDFRYEVEAVAGSVVIDGEEKGILNRENVIDNPKAVKNAKLECKTGAVNIEFQ